VSAATEIARIVLLILQPFLMLISGSKIRRPHSRTSLVAGRSRYRGDSENFGPSCAVMAALVVVRDLDGGSSAAFSLNRRL
jgi:hypothetical protein